MSDHRLYNKVYYATFLIEKCALFHWQMLQTRLSLPEGSSITLVNGCIHVLFRKLPG